ncbi:MAG: inovirus-type Gp2 protein [Cellvibrio sp.]
MNQSGDFIVDYLDRFENVINSYVRKNLRTLAIRIDLHFPENYAPSSGHNYAGDFIRKLQARVNSDLARKQREGKRVHPCKIGYVWVKEVGESYLRITICCCLTAILARL